MAQAEATGEERQTVPRGGRTAAGIRQRDGAIRHRQRPAEGGAGGNGALTALAGNNLTGALASGASPYLATEIKRRVGEDNIQGRHLQTNCRPLTAQPLKQCSAQEAGRLS
ncbi:hypothetical protein M8494_08960 [Serratia ureilytica]